MGFNVNSNSQIFPIIIGKEKITLEFGDYLFKNGIFEQPIRYPTVPRNYARIRISITARLTSEHIEKSLSVLCLLYTSPSPRDVEESRMPSSA